MAVTLNQDIIDLLIKVGRENEATELQIIIANISNDKGFTLLTKKHLQKSI